MPRPQKKYHYIYRTTCSLTGKFYVGMHSTDDIDDGYLGSGKILGYSRAKHGDENHVREIVEFLPTREALKLREKEIVNEELLADPLNMNLKYGGEGGWDHKPGVNIQQQKVDAKQRAKSAALTISKRRKDPEFEQWYLESRKKAAATSSRFNGKNHHEETKQKMRKPKNQGSANSQYGTCWVTNGTPIKIKKDKLGEYLANGFVQGRKVSQ